MTICRNILLVSVLLCIGLAGCVYPVPEYNTKSIEAVPAQVAQVIKAECQDGEIIESIIEHRFKNRLISFRATLYSASLHHRRQVLFDVATARLIKLTECKIKSGVWHERNAQGHETCDAP